jgi:hypothetical protein
VTFPRFVRVPVGLLLVLACNQDLADPAVSLPPSAIIGGEPDLNPTLYPFVGAMLVDWNDVADSGEPDGQITAEDQWCTVSLVARNRPYAGNPAVPNGSYDIALTAAHCIAFPAPVPAIYVSFDQDLRPQPATILASHVVPDPLFGGGLGDLHDLALVFLPAGSTPNLAQLATLPPAGVLDQMSAQGGLRGVEFVNVGYGADVSFKGHPPLFSSPGQRLVSFSTFMGLRKAWLGLLMNQDATGLGGDCYGDSGSPKLLRGGDGFTIYATVTLGDAVCRATSWDYRLDTPSARGFLGAFLDLP